jgi:predicted RNA binding protein YcfA (HicA-like mRNA interferase family)
MAGDVKDDRPDVDAVSHGPLNQKEAISLLTRHGWEQKRGGRHVVKMTKAGHRPITLPMHKRRDYSPGLTASILRQAGLTTDDL